MSKILIIDDDQDITESMKIVLETKGHSVNSALNGPQGLEELKKQKPDLVILDVVMPDMDGFEVSRIIKNDEKNKDIPILMLTAIKEKSGLDFKKEAGDKDWLPVDDYCEKPLDHDVLIAKVEKLLQR